ncbi:MAG: hypothetical protein A2231_06710 [Candidatus Firestonebacteria bacterium RIFOXYA2_FULL_40_8]|nr:MAG: hypothetical protein A2231_06710 [Candidatus Firestonebacteria bacterium RIFOXYA2_FULL_40_8]
MAEILIVDDEKNILEALKYLLGDDHLLTFCNSGTEALNVIKKKNFDIALLDLQLGDLSGNEVLRKIKERSKETAVIMMSAHKRKDLVFDAGRLGAEDYLFKPFDNVELLNLIDSILKRKNRTIDISADEYSDLEISVMRLLLEGKTNIEMSIVLKKSEPSIKNAVHMILQKLKAKNRLEAVSKISGLM